jgi:hypothetical protein
MAETVSYEFDHEPSGGAAALHPGPSPVHGCPAARQHADMTQRSGAHGGEGGRR